MVYVLYLILLGLGLGVSSLAAWLRVRQQRPGVVLQTLASIVSQNLPLVPALRAAATAERRALRRIYTRLAQRLELGDDLCTAVRGVLPSCPGEIIGALQGGQEGGTLPGVLQSLAARWRRDTWRPSGSRVPMWYPLLLLLVVPAVVTFVLVNVVPKFESIFKDFEVGLPAATVSLVYLANWLERCLPVWLLLLLAVLVGLLQALVGRYFFTRLPDRWQPLFALWDTLVWAVPGLRAIAQHQALAQQLPLMQAALRAGHDLGAAARQGGCAAVNWHARRRLARWATMLEAGADSVQSARQLGFPSPLVEALLTARADGELAARFEYLAEYYQTLYGHRRRVLAAVCTPLMVMAWGLAIGAIVLALFLPLVALLRGVFETMT